MDQASTTSPIFVYSQGMKQAETEKTMGTKIVLGFRVVAVSVELFVDVVLTAAFTPILLTLP